MMQGPRQLTNGGQAHISANRSHAFKLAVPAHSVVKMADMRTHLLCQQCNRTFSSLSRHWDHSGCGPARGQSRQEALAEAKLAARSLTKTAAVITQEELDQLAGRPDPMASLLTRLGTKLVPRKEVSRSHVQPHIVSFW